MPEDFSVEIAHDVLANNRHMLMWGKEDDPLYLSRDTAQTVKTPKPSPTKKVIVTEKQPKIDLEELGCKKWHEEIKRKSSIFNDTLMGQLLSTITCSLCKHTSNTFEPFFALELPLPNKPKATLKDCFSELCKEELVDGAFCQQCKKSGKMKKNLQIWRLPPILVINFKRFKHKGDEIIRNDCLVNVNLVGEDLGYTLAHLSASKVKKQVKVYQPFSFIVVYVYEASHRELIKWPLYLFCEELFQPRVDIDR